MEQKNLEELMAGIKRMLKDSDEFEKAINYQQEQVDFLLNEWKTNKMYFAPNVSDSEEVTVEDVIKAVFYFGWGSRGNFDHTQEEYSENVQEFTDYLDRIEREFEDNDDENSASVVEDIAIVFSDIFEK